MNRWTLLVVTFALFALVAAGCSSDGSVTTPSPDVTNPTIQTAQVQTQLWGYWDLYFDFENEVVEAVPNRQAEFAANVVSFLNSKGGLAFGINETIVDPAFIDVDIDVSMTHPLAGLPMYDGYDVRGIFIGDGSENLAYDGDLAYANYGGDQFLLPDPDDGIGGPDGYTRWWNPDEFPAPGLLGYTPGAFATPGYTGDATLNGYKYFADDLDADGDLWDFLTTTGDNGVFSSGATNTRNYYIRFPNPVPGVKYGYAVCASWKGEDLVLDHPANAVEAQGCDVTITDNIYFVDGTDNGGDFIADISVQGWSVQPSVIFIESEVLSAPYEFDATDMTPTGGTGTYSTYHVEIPADNVTFNSVTGQDGEYWVICEYGASDYKYPDDPSVPAPDAPLAAFFRYNDLFIADEPYNQAPVCSFTYDPASPISGYVQVCVDFDASGSTDSDGTIVTYEWDFDDDGVFGDTYSSGTDVLPTKCWTADYVGDIGLKVTDDLGASSECSLPIDITVLPLWSEDFDTDPGNWCLQTYQYWSGCTQGAPCWRNTAPYGVAAGSLQVPCTGNFLYGGALATFVSPSFFMPTSAEVNFRCRAMWDLGGSYAYYTKTNFAIANATGTGCSPFSTTNCSGGTIMSTTAAHGGTTPAGWVTSGGSGPCSAYAGWRGNFGSYPANITTYIDLVVPAANKNTDVKVAFRSHPDWCYYPGTNDGIILDDCEIKLY